MQRKTSRPKFDDFEFFVENNISMARRELYLGYISPQKAIEFHKNLLILQSKSSRPITIHIQSPGGRVSAGWAIYDALKMSKAKIVAICWGQCASMATIILQACDIRYMSPNCSFMIHEGVTEGGDTTELRSVLTSAHDVKAELRKMYELYEEKTGLRKKDLELLMRADCYLTAEEAVELGFADEVLKFRKIGKKLKKIQNTEKNSKLLDKIKKRHAV